MHSAALATLVLTARMGAAAIARMAAIGRRVREKDLVIISIICNIDQIQKRRAPILVLKPLDVATLLPDQGH